MKKQYLILLIITIILCYISAMTAIYMAENLKNERENAKINAEELLVKAEKTSNIKENTKVIEDFPNFPVIGKLYIEKINLEIAIISEFSYEGLKISICRYSGPVNIGEKGNLIITGHNYKNGSHFGELSKLEEDDLIKIVDVWGKEFLYKVYEVKRILPDDIRSLNEYKGTESLMLLTCLENANSRLLVRCEKVII